MAGSPAAAVLLALAAAAVAVGAAVVQPAEAVRALQAAGASSADLQVTATAGAATATAVFDLRVAPGGPVRLLLLPTPGSPAYGNGSAAAGWWTEARAGKLGEPLLARGGTAGGDAVALGDWEADAVHRLEVAIRLPPGAAQPGRSYTVHYAVAAPDVGASTGSGGDYEASLGLAVRVAVVAPGPAGGSDPSPTEPAEPTEPAPPAAGGPAGGSGASAGGTTQTVTVTEPPASRERDAAVPDPGAGAGFPLAGSPWNAPWSAREVLLLALLMLAVGYLAGSRRRQRPAPAPPVQAPAPAATE